MFGGGGGSSKLPSVGPTPIPASTSILTAGLQAFRGYNSLISNTFAGLRQKSTTVKSKLLGGR